MPKPQHEPADLSDLISSASDQIAVGEARRKTRIYQSNVFQRALPVVLVVTLLISSAWALESMWHHLAPHSEEKVIRDLTAIVEQARHAIETVRIEQGRLPEVIPNASLASVVFYDYRGEAYRLIAESGSVRVTLNPDGSQKIDKGNLK